MKLIFGPCLQCPFFSENIRGCEARFASIFYKWTLFNYETPQEKKRFMVEINSNSIYGFWRRTKQKLTLQRAFISTIKNKAIGTESSPLCQAYLSSERLSEPYI